MNFSEILRKNDRKSKKKAAAKVAAGMGLGAIAGAIAGTLLAPKSGKETREDIAKGAKDTFEKAKNTVNETKEKINKAMDSKMNKQGTDTETAADTVEAVKKDEEEIVSDEE